MKTKYKLFIKWDKISYLKNNCASLKNVCLSGPVMKEVEKINDGDSIIIDLSSESSLYTGDFYFLKLSWGKVVYKEGNAHLKNAVLSSSNLNNMNKFTDSDYLVVDTEKHERSVHSYNLVYKTYLHSKIDLSVDEKGK